MKKFIEESFNSWDNILQEISVNRTLARLFRRKDKIKKAAEEIQKLIDEKKKEQKKHKSENVEEAQINRAVFSLSKRKDKIKRIIEKLHNMISQGQTTNKSIELQNSLRKAQSKIADIEHKMKMAAAR